MLINPNVEIARQYLTASEVVARELRLSIHLVEARSLGDLEEAFDAMVKARVQAVVVNP